MVFVQFYKRVGDGTVTNPFHEKSSWGYGPFGQARVVCGERLEVTDEVGITTTLATYDSHGHEWIINGDVVKDARMCWDGMSITS